MKLINSPLQFEKFNLLQYEYKFNVASGEKVSKVRETIFPKYTIDIDFAWQKNNNDQLVFCKIEINRGSKKLPGYSIFIEGVGIFKCEDNNDEAQKKSLIKFAATSILIHELRSVIRANTLIAPFGAYVLPTINIQQQVNEKLEQFKKNKAPVAKKVIKAQKKN